MQTAPTAAAWIKQILFLHATLGFHLTSSLGGQKCPKYHQNKPNTINNYTNCMFVLLRQWIICSEFWLFGFYTQHFTFRSFSDKGCVKKDDIVPIEELESVLRVNVVLSSAISAKWSVCCLVQFSWGFESHSRRK